MPFKMTANRSVYRIDEGKEYKKGESFMVATEKDRDRLLRYKRASLDETKEVPAKSVAKPVEVLRAPAPVVQKVMTTEEPVTETPPPPASAADVSEASQPTSNPKPNRYRRSDMRAED